MKKESNVSKYVSGYKTSYSNPEAGVYELVNKLTGLVYVGSTTNIHDRVRVHLGHLVNENHPNQNVQEIFNMSPEFELNFIPVDSSDKKDLILKEQELIGLHEKNGILLNIALDAEVSAKGRKLSESQRFAILKATTGRVKTPEEIEKIRLGHLGVRMKESAKEKLRQYRTGLKLSDEHKAKISAGGKGRITSDETKNFLRNNPSSRRPVVISGIEYPSIPEAARQLNITAPTVRGRILSNNKEYEDWKPLTPIAVQRSL